MDSENQKENKNNEQIPDIEDKKNDKKEIEIPKFDEFINLSCEEFGVNCVNCISKFFSVNLYICSLKIYSKEKFNVEIKVKKKLADFERLYKLINSKYDSKINLQPFPNFLFTKAEEFMNYFDNLLNSIVKIAKENEEMKIIFLKFLYKFFIEDENKEISDIKRDIISDMFRKDLSPVSQASQIPPVPTTPKSSKFKISFNNLINSYKKEKKQPKDKEKDKEKEKDKDNKKKVKNKELDNEIFTDINIIDNIWEDISIKLPDEEQFKGTIKIVHQCMFISRNKQENNIEELFDYVIPLYNINVNIKKYRYSNNTKKSLLYSKIINSKEVYDIYYSDINNINLKLEEINTNIELTLYHNYNNYYINILFCEGNTINQLKNFVEFIENNSYILFHSDINVSPYIKSIDEKYINIYGLLYINLDSLQIRNISEECFVQITSFPYTFNTKKLINNGNNENNIFQINQQFIIPIHNRFGKIKFEIYQDVFKGVLIKSKEYQIVYESSIEITKILNCFNNEEINFNLIFNPLEKEKEIPKRKKSSCDDESENKNKKIRTNLLITIKDYSSPFVLLEKNKNKYILEDLEAGDDNLGIKILFKRIRKMFYLFDELNLRYKSIYQFKYPIFSFLCIIYIFGNLYFIESKYIVKFIITLLIIILFSQCQIYKIYLESYINKYIFSYENPYNFKSKVVSTKNEIEDKELKNPEYLIEKDEISFINDILDPLTNYNKYKLKYLNLIVKITKHISSVEKIKNLFLWTDPKLTIYFLILLIMSYLLLYKIDFKYLIIFSMSKKFIIGFFYYRNKYQNNKEIGRILLEHAVKNWRELIGNNNTKFERLRSQIDLATIRVFDHRFMDIIINIFETNSNTVLSSHIFNMINSLKDMQNEIGKCEGILKIKKISPLYRYIKNNDKILRNEVEIEDLFYYFVQNIKSDFYILRNKSDTKNINLDNNDKINERYLSLSSENFISKNNKDNEINDKNKEDIKDINNIINKK